MITHTARVAGSVLLAAAVAATTPAGTALAASQDDAKPRPPIESAKGDKYRMANTKMADRVTRFADATGDQSLSDSSPATEAPEWSDIVSVTVAPTRTPAKLLTKMAKDFPDGQPSAFYGMDADWQKGDRAVFVAVEMAGKLPRDAAGQLIEVGLDGDGATPVQAGAADDPRLGIERFSLSGLFGPGPYDSGTTDVAGRAPFEDAQMWNTEAGVFGFYDRKRGTWNLIMPRPSDAGSVTVVVDSYTEGGRVIDRLELPGGGHFVDLDDPTGGWGRKTGLPPLECRSLETFSTDPGVALSDPEGALVRYTAGMEVGADPDAVAALLEPAIDRLGATPVLLTEVGSADEPLIVEGELALEPGMSAISLTFEVPPGQWSFALADESELATPAGESMVDHTSLTGGAGVLVGPGLDGLVAGDLSCAIEASEPSDTDVADTDEADTDEAAPPQEVEG
jgi:hypothetical protein